MGKKLFIVTSNTQGLKYCNNDAKLMESCFGGQYDYQVFQPTIQKRIIQEQLDELIDNCQKTDTIILYFSGHGLVDGRLYFLLADDSSKSKNKLDINAIVDNFEKCRAKNKLIILDCCNAGLGHATWTPKISNKYFLLTASEFLEEAKELDSKQASFLTYHLVQSLENPSSEILNNENIIQLQSLYRVLIQQAREHNAISKTEIPVPIPNLVGNQKNDFDLVKANKPTKPFTDGDLQDYLRFLINRCATLDPRRVPRSSKTRNIVLPLEAIFITLKTGQNNPLEREAEQNLLDLEIRELARSLRLDPLENSFTDTDFRYQVLQREYLMLSERRLREISPDRDFGSALKEHRWLVFLGGPGSGKTTLAQWLTLQLAKLMLANNTRFRIPSTQLGLRLNDTEIDLGPVRFPIFVRIADYAKARQKDSALTLQDFIGQNPILGQYPSIPANIVTAICNHFIRNDNALVILDGLDEVIDPADRGEIRDQIERFVTDNIQDPENKQAFAPWTNLEETGTKNWDLAWWKSSNHSLPAVSGGNQVIITSRGAGYRAAVLRGEFAHYEIESFDDVSISRFCEKWCLAVERYLNRQSDSPLPDSDINEIAYQEAKNLTEVIFENSGVRKLASNPLLLTVLALLHRENSYLPTQRIRLYEQAVNALVNRRETNLDKAQVSDFLGPFALWLHENQPTGLATEKELQEHISVGLARWHGLDPKQPLPGKYIKEIESFIMQAREQSGLIVARGEGLYGFVHLSFQEYFVAVELTRNPYTVIDNLKKYLHRPRWVEPLILAIAYLSDTQRGSLEHVIEAILEADTSHDDILHRNLLFVASAIVDSVWIPPTVLQKIISEMLVILADNGGKGRFTLLREQIFDTFETIYRPDTSDTIENIIRNVLLTDSHLRGVAAEVIVNVSWSSPEILISCHDALSMEGDSSIIVDAFNALLQRIQNPAQYLPSYTLDSLASLYRYDSEVKEAIDYLIMGDTVASTFLREWAQIVTPYINPQLVVLLKTFVKSHEKSIPLFEEQVKASLSYLSSNNSGFVYRIALIALLKLKNLDYVTDLLQQNIESGIKVLESIMLFFSDFDSVLDKPDFSNWLGKQSFNTKQLFLELGSEVDKGWRLGNFAWEQLENSNQNISTPAIKLLVNLPDIKLTTKRLEILESLVDPENSEIIGIIGDILEQAQSYDEDNEICYKLHSWLSSPIPALNFYAAFLLGQTTNYFDLEVYNKLALALRSNNDRWRQWAARVLDKPRRFFSGAERLIEESARFDWEEQYILNDGMASLMHFNFRRLTFFDNFDFIERWTEEYEVATTQKDKDVACLAILGVSNCTSEFFESLLNKVELSCLKSVNECLVEAVVNTIRNESVRDFYYSPSLSDDVIKYAIETLSKVVQQTSDNELRMYAAQGIGLITRFPTAAYDELCKLLNFKNQGIKAAAIYGLSNLAVYHRGNNALRKSIIEKLNNLAENVPLFLRINVLAALAKSLVISSLDPKGILDIFIDYCHSDEEFLEAMFLAGEGDDHWDNITCKCGRQFHSKLIEVTFLRAARPPLLLEKIAKHVIDVSNLPQDKWDKKRFPLSVLAKCAKELPANLNQLNHANSLQERLLVTAADASSFNLRRFSLEILGQFRWVNGNVINVLIAGCRDLGIVQKASFAAVASMRRIDTNALPKLKKLLSSPSTATVYAASKVMHEIGVSQQPLRDQSLRDSIIEGIVSTVQESAFPRYVTIDGERIGLLDNILFSILFDLTSDEPLKSNKKPQVQIIESQLALSGAEQSNMREQALQMQKTLSNQNIHVSNDNIEVAITGDQKILSVAVDGQPLEHLLPILNYAIKESQKLAAKKLQSMTGGLGGLLDSSTEQNSESSDTDSNPLKALGDLNALREQAKRMQKELSNENIRISDDNIEVVISGDQKMLSVSEDGQMLEHLLPILNDAIKKSQELAAKELQSMTGGLGGLLDSSTEKSSDSRDTSSNPLEALGDLNALRAQAKRMQKELSSQNIHISDDNIEIKITGDQKVLSVAVEGQPLERLLPVLNDAIKKSQELAAKELQSMTGGLGGLLDSSTEKSSDSRDTSSNPLEALGDLNALQEQALQMQKTLSSQNIHVRNDNIEIKITGDQKVLSVAVEGQPLERLLPVLNDAIKKSQELAAKELQSMTGGLGGRLDSSTE